VTISRPDAGSLIARKALRRVSGEVSNMVLDPILQT
jgi:hypothetical protein